jgi:hypothetical protein
MYAARTAGTVEETKIANGYAYVARVIADSNAIECKFLSTVSPVRAQSPIALLTVTLTSLTISDRTRESVAL